MDTHSSPLPLSSLFRALRLFSLLLLTLAFTSTSHAAESVTTPQAKVSLISNRTKITTNESFWVGFYFELQPGWHIYYENPGDSGLAPSVQWQSNIEQTISPLNFPTPSAIPVGSLVNYGYSDQVLFPAEIKIGQIQNSPSSVELQAKLRWLICHEDCIPGKADLSLTLPFDPSSSEASSSDVLFQKNLIKLPSDLTEQTKLSLHEADGDILLELPSNISTENSPYFFAAQKGIVKSSAAQTVAIKQDKKSYLKLTKSPSLKNLPETVAGIIRYSEKGEEAHAIKIIARNPDYQTPVAAQDPTPAKIEQPSTSFISLLFFALIGGMILNLMPCVLPVLSLKVLSLCNQAHDSKARQIFLATCYTLGVISSLLALASVLLFIRSQGSQVGWGFQLQYPPVVGLLALFFYLMGLSFLGFYEINSSLTNKAAQLDTKEGVGGAFLSGLLATIVATPCTAPFMGTAIGVALFRPWFETLLIFAMLGLGIALPYILLVVFPYLRKFLPRPGEWMITLKEFLAFPLFATSLWLLWVLGVQRGGPGIIMVLFSALLATLAIWLLKRTYKVKKSIKRSLMFIASIAIFFGGVAVIPLPDALSLHRDENKRADDSITDSHGFVWEKYSTEKVASLSQQGALIYIDFTAAWCITCQVNKAIVLSDGGVQDYIKNNNVKLLRADWTNQDPEITKALSAYGRVSVPLNLIYGEKTGTKPIVLPSILTPQIVLGALERAQGNGE